MFLGSVASSSSYGGHGAPTGRVFPCTYAWDVIGGRRNTSELLRIRDPSDVVKVEFGRIQVRASAERVDADNRLCLVVALQPPRLLAVVHTSTGPVGYAVNIYG